MMKHQLKLYNQVNFQVLPGNSIGGSLESILSLLHLARHNSSSVQKEESGYMVNLKSNILCIVTLVHIILKVLFILFFGMAFNFLFDCRFLLIKGTEKTGICMKTYGLSCLMRPFVIG